VKTRFTILEETADLVVVDKPAHLLTVPDRYRAELPNLLSILLRKYGEIYPVHRLDRETSGLLCFARNLRSFKHLSDAFEKRLVSKTYKAIVRGVPSQTSGTIDHPLFYDKASRRSVVSAKGKPSVTRYEVIEAYKGFALLQLNILTGRTHQIRAHLQFIGYPLVVDPIYGGAEALFLSQVKVRYRKKDRPENPLLSRVPLHASRLEVPTLEDAGTTWAWTSSLPKDMRATTDQLRKLREAVKNR